MFHRRLTNCAKFYVFYIRSSSHSRQYLKDEVICVAKQSGETTTGNLPLRFPKTYFAAQVRQNVVMRIADLFPPAAFTNPTRDLLPLCTTVKLLLKMKIFFQSYWPFYGALSSSIAVLEPNLFGSGCLGGKIRAAPPAIIAKPHKAELQSKNHDIF